MQEMDPRARRLGDREDASAYTSRARLTRQSVWTDNESPRRWIATNSMGHWWYHKCRKRLGAHLPGLTWDFEPLTKLPRTSIRSWLIPWKHETSDKQQA